MSIYDEIKQQFNIPNAFENWANYRNTLTNYLIEATDENELPLQFHCGMSQADFLPSLAIVGAGACNDLDLSLLTEHFSTITLIDNDKESLDKAMNTYHIYKDSPVKILHTSLTQIYDTDYQDFCNELLSYIQLNGSALTYKAFDDFACSILNKYLQKSRVTPNGLAPASYDYVWCFGVHSQLFSMFSYIYQVFFHNLCNSVFASDTIQTNTFGEIIKVQNTSFIPLFHNALLKCAKKSVFIGCEKNRLNDDTAIEGAHQAILDIRSRNLATKEQVILWPFYPEKDIFYEMLIERIDF